MFAIDITNCDHLYVMMLDTDQSEGPESCCQVIHEMCL